MPRRQRALASTAVEPTDQDRQVSMDRNRAAFFLLEHGSEPQLDGSWRTWNLQLCARVAARFFGFATKPAGLGRDRGPPTPNDETRPSMLGSSFAPQSATRRLVASASPSGRYSEEPRVVVTRATCTDHKKTRRGHSRPDLLLYFNLVACFGETESHLRRTSSIRTSAEGTGQSRRPVPYQGLV